MKDPIEALAELTGGAVMLENCSGVPRAASNKTVALIFQPRTPKERNSRIVRAASMCR
jgi:hypothetical protein